MPSAAAPMRSLSSARRLRSRQVIWRIGSIPFCMSSTAAAALDICALAPAPSVRLTAVAMPLSGSARFRRSSGSAETGGATSAVMTNLPLSRAAAKLLMERPSALFIRRARLSQSRHAREVGVQSVCLAPRFRGDDAEFISEVRGQRRRAHPNSIPIVIRLERAGLRHIQILRLLRRELGQLHAELFEMQRRHFLVEVLRQHVDLVLVLAGIGPELDLR